MQSKALSNKGKKKIRFEKNKVLTTEKQKKM